METKTSDNVDESGQTRIEDRTPDYEKVFEVIEATYADVDDINKFDIKAKLDITIGSNVELNKEQVAALIRNRIAGVHSLTDADESDKIFIRFTKQKYDFLKRS